VISRFQRFSIYLFAFSLNFETVNLFNLDIDYLASKITFVICLFFSLINLNNLKSTVKYLFFLWPLLIFFIDLTIVSFINRAGSTASFFYFPLFLDLAVVFLLLSAIKRNPDSLFGALIGFSVGTIFLAILFFLNIEVETTADDRQTIFKLNQNILGLYTCISLLTFLYVLLKKEVRSIIVKFLLIGAISILLLLQLKTGSRVAFFSLVVAIPFFLFVNNNLTALKNILITFVLSMIGTFIWFFFLANSVIGGRLSASLIDGDLSNRDLIWISIFDIIVNNYWFGIGVTGYERIIGTLSPHNVIIEVLCYSGVFGLLLFVIFVFNIGKSAYKNFNKEGNVLPLALFIPTIGLILSGQIFEQRIVWIIFAYQIALVTRRIKTRKKITKPTPLLFSLPN